MTKENTRFNFKYLISLRRNRRCNFTPSIFNLFTAFQMHYWLYCTYCNKVFEDTVYKTALSTTITIYVLKMIRSEISDFVPQKRSKRFHQMTNKVNADVKDNMTMNTIILFIIIIFPMTTQNI